MADAIIASPKAIATARGIAPIIMDDVWVSSPKATATAKGIIPIIYAPRIQSFTVRPGTLTIEAGSRAVVSAAFVPRDWHDKRVTWTTDDNDIASVTGDGVNAVVRGNADGPATITATSVIDPSFSATCAVTVAAYVPTAFSVLEILDKTFTLVETIQNKEIIDLTINKELSGNYSLDFVLPMISGAVPGATGYDEIIEGRYIQTEGNKFRIDQIKPRRGDDGNPVLGVSCTHNFFEIENLTITETQIMRGNVIDHLRYILQGTNFVVVATGTDADYYNIQRFVTYNPGDNKLDAVKEVFNIIGGNYRLRGDQIEVIPYPSALVATDVAFEYAVNNKDIERVTDDTGVVTVLYATGGEYDGVELRRVYYAPIAIRNQYRREKIRFVSFGDVIIWNNFNYLAEQYLERNMYPRTTYTLSVAELNRLTPALSGNIDVGKSVEVKDTDLGIDTIQLVQRYSYKPLLKEHASQVVVGDKPPDITWSESRETGTEGGVEGEWRYDETTGEWVFFPDEDWDDGTNVGTWDLEIGSIGPGSASIRYYVTTPFDEYEVSELHIGLPPINKSGNITFVLDGVTFHTAVVSPDDGANEIAIKVAAGVYPGWEAVRDGTKVTFTATDYGAKQSRSFFVPGETGVEAEMRTNKGSLAGVTSPVAWGFFPWSRKFPDGAVVDLTVVPGDDHTSVLQWYGDGTGAGWLDEARSFTMTDHRDATVRLGLNFDFTVTTNDPTLLGEETVTLNGAVTELEKYDEVTRGFVYGPTDADGAPTLESNTAIVNAAAGGIGAYDYNLIGFAAGDEIYWRAYAKVFDYEMDEEFVVYGEVRYLQFARPGHWGVTIGANINTDLVTITPYVGTKQYVDGGNITVQASAMSSDGRSFTKWDVDGADETDNPLTIDPISADVEITAIYQVVNNRLSLSVQGGDPLMSWGHPDSQHVDIYWPSVRVRRRLPYSEQRLGAQVRVYVMPAAVDSIEGWTGDGTGSGTKSGDPRIFDMTGGDQSATLVFKGEAERVPNFIYGYISDKDPQDGFGEEDELWFKYE